MMENEAVGMIIVKDVFRFRWEQVEIGRKNCTIHFIRDVVLEMIVKEVVWPAIYLVTSSSLLFTASLARGILSEVFIVLSMQYPYG